MQTLDEPKASLLADQLFSVLTNLTQGSESRLLAIANELELSLSQMRALMVLWQASEPVSLGELARGVGLSDAATVRIVDRLIDAGLTGRREDSHDRRIKRISLSEHGRQTVGRLVDAKREMFQQFSDQLSGEERDRLHAALAPIVERLGLAP